MVRIYWFLCGMYGLLTAGEWYIYSFFPKLQMTNVVSPTTATRAFATYSVAFAQLLTLLERLPLGFVFSMLTPPCYLVCIYKITPSPVWRRRWVLCILHFNSCIVYANAVQYSVVNA